MHGILDNGYVCIAFAFESEEDEDQGKWWFRSSGDDLTATLYF